MDHTESKASKVNVDNPKPDILKLLLKQKKSQKLAAA